MLNKGAACRRQRQLWPKVNNGLFARALVIAFRQKGNVLRTCG
jgi:hypothetical protein